MGVDIKMYAVKIRYPNGRYGMAGTRTGKKGKTWSSIGAFKCHLAGTIATGDWRLRGDAKRRERLANAMRKFGECVVEEVKIEDGKTEVVALPFEQWCERNSWPPLPPE